MLVNYSNGGVCNTIIFHIGITHDVIVSNRQTDERSGDRRAADGGNGRNDDGQSTENTRGQADGQTDRHTVEMVTDSRRIDGQPSKLVN